MDLLRPDKKPDKKPDTPDKINLAHVRISGQTGHHPVRDVRYVRMDGACPGWAPS